MVASGNALIARGPASQGAMTCDLHPIALAPSTWHIILPTPDTNPPLPESKTTRVTDLADNRIAAGLVPAVDPTMVRIFRIRSIENRTPCLLPQ
jgi:hypothetical protein